MADIRGQFLNTALCLTQRLGKSLVNDWQLRTRDLFHFNGELSGFACHFFTTIIGRKRQWERFLVASFQATYGGFKLGQHATLTEDKGEIFSRATIKSDVINFANEINFDLVVIARRAAFFSHVLGTLLTKNGQCLFDFSFCDSATGTLDGHDT